jgi:branched-chain amino acid transport system substrate-binding protein
MPRSEIVRGAVFAPQNWRSLVGTLVLILATLLQAGCSSAPSSSGVRVGAILPLSGENASFGTTARAAYQIAQDDAANQGLPKITLVYGDSKLDKDLALREFRRLVDNEKVVAFVETTGSGVALALAPLAEKERIPILSGINSSPELTEKGGPYFFRVIPSDSYSGKVLSEWAVGEGLRTAALVYNQQNGWATGFKSAITAAFPAAGGTLQPEAVVPVSDDTIDFSGAIARLRAQRPQVWFVGLMGRQAALLVKQAAERGIHGPFFGVDNLAQTEFAQGAGAGLKYTMLALPAEVQSPRATEFTQKYKTLEKRDPDAIAFKAYDSYMVLAHAIKDVSASALPITGPNIQVQLEKTNLDGLAGPIQFDSHHDLKNAKYDRFTFSPSGEKVLLPPR